MDSFNTVQVECRVRSTAPLGSTDRACKLRLSTPDNSAGSGELDHDGQSPHKRRRIDSDDQHAAQARALPRIDASHHTYRSRRDSAVHSPQCKSAEPQRPSLPSLSTILNSDQFSPPKTPSPPYVRREPSPREPSFTTSFLDYPHKPSSLLSKERQLESIPSSTYMGAKQSQHAPSSILEPRSNGSVVRPSLPLPPISASFEPCDVRRAPYPPINSSHAPASPGWVRRYPSPVLNTRLATDRFPYNASNSSAHRTPDRTPISSTPSRADSFAGPLPGVYRAIPEESRGASVPRDFERYFHHATLPACHSGCAPHMHDREFPDRPYYRDTTTDYREHTHRGIWDDQRSPINMPGPALYPALHPSGSFFMPNHFDYQHGKSRKSSNLPKQSTEIMKRWFNQNISNPYPSEEQKQRFSSITGISLTQVSNWFINHRRRCPELRDKREKCRGREEDASV